MQIEKYKYMVQGFHAQRIEYNSNRVPVWLKGEGWRWNDVLGHIRSLDREGRKEEEGGKETASIFI